MEQSEIKTPAKGGLLGFLKGTQPLSTAFWIIGVIPAIILFLILIFVINDPLDLSDFLLYSIGLVGLHRLFAWFSIIRCRKNTARATWGSLALAVVVLDILFKGLFAGMYMSDYFEKEIQKQELFAVVNRCKSEISRRFDIPLSELKANNFMNNEGKHSYYGVTHQNEYYKCYVHPDSIEIKKLDLWSDSGESLHVMLEDRIRLKRDSIYGL